MFPARRLRAMLMAGAEASECRRVLERGGINLVSEVLRGQGEFVEFEHYPKEDVYDPESRAQYYYHAHRGIRGEHGHFHTFLRQPDLASRRTPSSDPETRPGPAEDDEAVTHLIAISMDAYGWPTGLFATNHWVTGGQWRSAEDTIGMLPGFQIDHAYPSWPVNRWLGAMFILFRPQIEALLRHRDHVVAAWAAAHPGCDVHEDRSLDVTGFISVDVERTVETVRDHLHIAESG